MEGGYYKTKKFSWEYQVEIYYCLLILAAVTLGPVIIGLIFGEVEIIWRKPSLAGNNQSSLIIAKSTALPHVGQFVGDENQRRAPGLDVDVPAAEPPSPDYPFDKKTIVAMGCFLLISAALIIYSIYKETICPQTCAGG